MSNNWKEILESAPAGSFDVDVDEDGKLFIIEDSEFVGVEIHPDEPDEVYEPEYLGDR